jgi:hypothetical protein
MPPSTLIGVDCATVPAKTGLARAVRDGAHWRLAEVRLGSRERPPAAVLSGWLAAAPDALVALDAPLGWPTALAAALATHRAGAGIDASADRLFARATDRDVRARFGKRPLEVGADLIARTALAALTLLTDVRARSGLALPLAWSHAPWRGAAAIEVYPAATLLAHGVAIGGYKTPGGAARARVVAGWPETIAIPEGVDLLALPADAFDAVVALLAAADFAAGRAVGPEDRAEVEREGWMWVRGR